MQKQLYNDFIKCSAHARPAARANIAGSARYPELKGYVNFFPYRSGAVMIAELWGLPHAAAPCAPNIYAMHIHAGDNCSDSMNMAFGGAGGHFDPAGCPHPAHAGDLPPLFGNRGYAWSGFYTERFTVDQIVGKTVVIHSQRDDFKSQPAGDSGQRIGCGVIQAV